MPRRVLVCLPTVLHVGMVPNVVEARLILDDRLVLSDTTFVEMIIWRVPQPVHGSAHPFKYRLALVSDGTCVLRYDNEAGKGDHKHIDAVEMPHRFIDLATLQREFWKDVETWMDQQGAQ